MAERRPVPAAPRTAAGFTLAEMLAALAILLIGVTTLLASLTNSVGLRRSTEARLAIAHAVEDVVLQVRQNGLRQRDGGTVLDLDLSLPGPIEVPGFAGARIAVRSIDDPEQPGLLLLELTATWLEAGEMIRERFLRVLPRQLPLGARVQRFQNEVPR